VRNNYKERILNFLSQSTAPIDVEKIRKSCKIANWNTTLKHCLELVFEGSIKGQTTSKGWIFWTHQETQLKPWEEARGTLDRIETSETQKIALLTCTYKKTIAISLPKDQPETQKLEKLIGCKIGILRTDNPKQSLIIRTFTETPDIKIQYSWNLELRQRSICVAFKGVALKFSLWLFGLRLSWWF
jgi:hypothetical protein